MLKQRVITAAALALAFLAALLLAPEAVFLLLMLAVMAVAAFEWGRGSGQHSPVVPHLYAGAMVAACALTWWLASPHLLLVTLMLCSLALLWWLLAAYLVMSYPVSQALWQHSGARLAMGCLVLLPAWQALVYLRGQGVTWVLILLGAVAAADSCAYFSGRAFGRRKLAPAVSPGKSWEGVWGGLLGVTLLASLLSLLLQDLSLLVVLWVCLPAALASVLGDLLESMVKRQAGVKDSGRILPGHGGILDRIDGITAAAPVFALSLASLPWVVQS